MSVTCSLVGAPVQSGASQAGCMMGPDALRTAGIAEVLSDLGHSVEDHGNVDCHNADVPAHSNSTLKNLGKTVGWAKGAQ